MRMPHRSPFAREQQKRTSPLPRPGGPPAKRKPSPEGLGINPEDDLSAVGAAPFWVLYITHTSNGPLNISNSTALLPNLISKMGHNMILSNKINSTTNRLIRIALNLPAPTVDRGELTGNPT